LKISRFIQLNKLKSFPYLFIQIVNISKNAQNAENTENSYTKNEPHLHYYKLNHLLKRENIDISLNYLNLNQPKETELEKLAKIFGVSKAEFSNADYFISNKQGGFMGYSDKEPKRSFECVKNFVIGMQKVSNFKELNQTISRLTPETITILTNTNREANKSVSNANAIVSKIFIEQASKFNINTYNFLEAVFNSNNNNIKLALADNEIVVFLNKKIYEVNNQHLAAKSADIIKISFNSNNNIHSNIEKSAFEVEFAFEKYFPNLEKFYAFNESLSQEDKESFENSEDNDVIILKEELNTNTSQDNKYKLEDDYLIALRLRFPINAAADFNLNNPNANVDFVSKLLRNLININGTFNDDSSSITDKTNDTNYTNSTMTTDSDGFSGLQPEKNPPKSTSYATDNIIKRINYTDNIDIAIFNKLNYYANRNKILLLYLNSNNLLSESSSDLDLITQQLQELIEKLQKDFPGLKFICTANPVIFNLFNLLPSQKENISIRFMDYSKYAYFSKSPLRNKSNNSTYYASYAIINNEKDSSDLNHVLADKDRNLIFNFKTNFAEYADKLNYESLKAFISQSINLSISSVENNNVESQENNENKHKSISTLIKPYLECADDKQVNSNYYLDLDPFKKYIKNLNSNNFKREILSGKSLRSLILLYNQDCNGCQKVEMLLNDLLEETKFDKEIMFYRYNTLNENVYFKKFRNVPAAVLFENGRITKEIDLKKVIEENQNHDAAVKEVFGVIIGNENSQL